MSAVTLSRRKVMAVLLSVWSGFSGAQSQPQTGVAFKRIIVKPHTKYSDGAALLAAIRSKLPEESRLAYLHDLSGGAAVLQVTTPLTDAELQSLLHALQNTGLFEYVEPDRRMRINPPRR